MADDAELVELTTAKTAFEAEMFVGALKGFDVGAVTFGDQLMDEFAVSQKVMGLSGGVRVMVPRGQLERARQALAEIQQDPPTPDEVDDAADATIDDDDN
jgi:hypothetical protein